MGAFVAKRLLITIPVVWAALTLLFALFFLLPGDPVELIAGGGGARAVSESVRANIEARYGLDQPWYEQYLAYWGRTLTGDLGESYASRRSVTSILADTATASARLALWAVLFEVLIGISAGVLSAVRRYSFGDALTTVSTDAVSAIPVFVLGYLFQHVFGILPERLGSPDWLRLPVQGIGPDSWRLFLLPAEGQWRYLLLPAVTLASVSTALVARLTRTTMLEVKQADHMRAARAKGLSERRVVFRHGLRNALIPVVTLVGLNLADLIGSAILTETVFNWPGMGSAIADAITQRDAPVVLGGTLVLVLIYVGVNLLVDLSYGFLDPRIRIGEGGAVSTAEQAEVAPPVGPAVALAPGIELSPRREVWLRFRDNKLAVLGLVFIGLLVVAAFFAPLLTFYDPAVVNPANARRPPSAEHWFGTDQVGRDLYTRVVYGARVSLRVGVVSVAIATVIGVTAGAVAGYCRGVVDAVVMRATDVLLAFPYILAAIAIISVFGPGERTVILVLGLLGWLAIARVLRSSVLQVTALEYVAAARALGASGPRILARHVLPNAIQPVIVYATLFVGSAILSEAALSFLGLGIQEPTPAWGLMVNQGRRFLATSPHLLFFPGAAIFVIVSAFVFVGDGLRDALDPRLQ